MASILDQDQDQSSSTHTNPLFDLSMNHGDMYSFHTDDLKPARTRSPWCLRLLVVYLLMQMALNAFLLYKVFTLESLLYEPKTGKLTSSNEIPLPDQGGGDIQVLVHNNTEETRTLKGRLWTLENQVDSVYGAQLTQLRNNINLLNSSTNSLESKVTSISLKPGPVGPPGLKGLHGEPGLKGDPGSTGPSGPKGDSGVKGEAGGPGPAGPQGLVGAQGSKGASGAEKSGSKGEPGVAGSAGAKGDPGATGISGPPGTPGLKGEKGDGGQEGPAGPAGPAGPQGEPGAPGAKGDMASNVQVRLVPGPNRGRVEVLHDREWGTVCDDNFDLMDGKVICGMLGFTSATDVFIAEAGSGQIWLDDLRCLGKEADIFSCTHNGYGIHNCKHSEDAGVQCV